MSKMKRSWNLFTGSLKIMKRNRKLMVFPILGLIPILSIASAFIIPVMLANFDMNAFDRGNTDWLDVLLVSFANYWPLMILIYFVSIFILTFVNVAFYQQILRAMNQEKVSLTDGFSFATTKLKAITMWSLFASAIGVLIKGLEQISEGAVRYFTASLGFAWSIATVFVVPVLINEKDNENPIKVLKSSGKLIKKTWGEGLIGFVGINIIGYFLVVGLLLSVVALAASFLIVKKSIIVFLASLVLTLVLTIIIGYIQSVLTNIYKCALYIYANEGVIIEEFPLEALESGWKVKQ